MDESDFNNLVEVFRLLKKWREDAEVQAVVLEETQKIAIQ